MERDSNFEMGMGVFEELGSQASDPASIRQLEHAGLTEQKENGLVDELNSPH